MVFNGRRPEKDSDSGRGVSYWESMADVLSGVLLIFILVVSLSALYSWRDPDEEGRTSSDLTETETGAWDGTSDHASDGNRDGGYGWEEQTDHAGAGGERETDHGGGGGRETEPVTEETEDALAAVRLILIDGRTGKVVPQGEIQFELLDDRGAVQTLYSYYPTLQKYHLFETTDQGDFYLPERIPIGTYAFHLLSKVEGYDSDLVQYFTVDQAYTWKDPYEMKFVLTRGKLNLTVTLTDGETGEGVGGASFTLIAQDGSEKGRAAASLTTDGDGKAQVLNLDSGRFLLRQDVIPDGYASIGETEVDLTDQSGMAEVELTAEKTEAEVILTDALDQTPLSGADFQVTRSPGGTEDASGRTLTTDEDGSFTLTDLDKSATYTITQTAAARDGYRMIREPVSFTVDSDGRIDGESRTQIALTNEINRLKISLTDFLLGKQSSGLTAQLTGADGDVTEVSSGQTVEGLSAGTYTLTSSGGLPLLPAESTVTVTDRAAVQKADLRVFTAADLLLAAAAAAALAAAVVLLVRSLVRRRSKKK